jgi:hypothetical protein
MSQQLLRFVSKPILLVGSLSISVFFLVNSASAAIVPLVPGTLVQSFPDVTAGMVDVTYDADTDAFRAGIDPAGILTIDQDGSLPTPDHTIFNASLNLFLTIDGAGVATVGTLSLSGNYDIPGGPFVSLASSDLAGFGYDPSIGVFSFLFDNATGTLPGFGPLIGINLAGKFPVLNPGGFATTFSNLGPLGGLGTADLFTPLVPGTFTPAVPVPSSMIVWLMCSSLTGLAGWRHARRRPKQLEKPTRRATC